MQKSKLQSLIDFDEDFLMQYPNSLFIGIDEVGRGSLAGPLCSAAFVFAEYKNLGNDLKILNDSKKVAKNKRDNLCRALIKNNNLYSIDFQSAKDIDEKGITKVIFQSMANNIKTLIKSRKILTRPIILIDGPKIIPKNFLDEDYIQIPIVKGDGKSACIAAASNLAKLHRDEYMLNLSKNFPDYGWQTNVGYGTKKHREAIKIFGPCLEHRLSFLSDELILSKN